MNERIRELAEQAWNDTAVSPDFGHPVSFAEKFAELIVSECIDLLREESERLYALSSEETDESFASNFQICAEKCWDIEVMVKEHFGVES
jgi:hypothetical protein